MNPLSKNYLEQIEDGLLLFKEPINSGITHYCNICRKQCKVFRYPKPEIPYQGLWSGYLNKQLEIEYHYCPDKDKERHQKLERLIIEMGKTESRDLKRLICEDIQFIRNQIR